MPIVEFNPVCDESDLIKFLNQALYQNYLSKSSKLFKWQFQGSASLKANEAGLILYKKEQDIMALLGYVPVSFRINGNNQEAAFLSHWFSNKKCQKEGGGVLPFMELRNRYPNHFVLGLSEQSKKILTKLGYFLNDDLPRSVFILNQENVSQYSNLKMPICSTPQTENLHTCNSIDHVWDLERLEKCFTRLKFSICVDRNKEYFKWRYVNHPVYEYQLIVANSKFRGFAIVRVEKVLNQNNSILRILDFIPPKETKECDELFNQIILFGKNQHCDLIDFFCSNKEILNVFKIRGWIHGRQLEDAKIPRLFQPLEYRENNGIVIAIKLKELTKACIGELWEKSYFTKSDGDQDRPQGFTDGLQNT
jgi:hypothetical protein